MGRGLRRPSPALCVSLIALFAALGGTVYAAGKVGKINGRAVKVKSMPGNRLKPGSVPANRLKPNAFSGASLAPGSIGGRQIDEETLGQVPSAVHAETADSAIDAETALNAVNAVNAMNVNGHTIGCKTGLQQFAGVCWEITASEAPVTAPQAADECALQGGTLPEALQLAAFFKLSGVKLSGEEEWSGDIPVISGPNAYAVVTVSSAGILEKALASETRKFRCVFPMIH